MRYMATLYVSDVMDVVAATVEIQGWQEQYGPPETIYSRTLVVVGVGETDPRRWLSRALIALSQDMSGPPEEGTSGGQPMGVPHTLSEGCDNPI